MLTGEMAIKQRCSKCQAQIDREVDEHYTLSWTYGNGSFICIYYCKDHEPHPKRARKDHRNGN